MIDDHNSLNIFECAWAVLTSDRCSTPRTDKTQKKPIVRGTKRKLDDSKKLNKRNFLLSEVVQRLGSGRVRVDYVKRFYVIHSFDWSEHHMSFT